MWPEPWGLAKSPSLSASPAPPSTQPLTGCPSPHNGCLSAEISRYWIPGLKFCPVTMSRQRSMLQGRHTLQVKSWKTIPPFISIKKGRTPPPHTRTYTHTQTHTVLFSIVCFLQHFSRVSNQWKAVFNLLSNGEFYIYLFEFLEIVGASLEAEKELHRKHQRLHYSHLIEEINSSQSRI